MPAIVRLLRTRTGFSLAVAILWLLVGVLGLEVFARAKWLYLEVRAQRFFETRVEGIPMMREATPEEVEQINAKARYARSKPMPVKDDVLPREKTANDADVVKRFLRLWRELDEDARNTEATIAGEFWALFDANGTLVTRFGDAYLDCFELGSCLQGKERLEDFGPLQDIEHGSSYKVENAWQPLYSFVAKRYMVDVSGMGNALPLFHAQFQESFDTLESYVAMHQGNPEDHVLENDDHWVIRNLLYLPNMNHHGIVTDQFGFKNLPVAVPKPGDHLRILFVGGSTTEDGEVAMPRMTNYLQDLLNQQYPALNIEVLNCAVVGTTSMDILLRGERYRRYEPDLIVYYEGINDLRQQLEHYKGNLPLLKRLVSLSEFLSTRYAEWLVDDTINYREYCENVIGRNLLALRQLSTDAGTELAVSSFVFAREEFLSGDELAFMQANARISWGSGLARMPTIERQLDIYNEWLREFSESRDIPYIPYAETVQLDGSHFRDFCHFSPTGMAERARIYAAWLKPWIEARAVRTAIESEPGAIGPR